MFPKVLLSLPPFACVLLFHHSIGQWNDDPIFVGDGRSLSWFVVEPIEARSDAAYCPECMDGWTAIFVRQGDDELLGREWTNRWMNRQNESGPVLGHTKGSSGKSRLQTAPALSAGQEPSWKSPRRNFLTGQGQPGRTGLLYRSCTQAFD
jgi:hypothetical protein